MLISLVSLHTTYQSQLFIEAQFLASLEVLEYNNSFLDNGKHNLRLEKIFNLVSNVLGEIIVTLNGQRTG